MKKVATIMIEIIPLKNKKGKITLGIYDCGHVIMENTENFKSTTITSVIREEE